MAAAKYAYGTFNFKLEINGLTLGHFQNVTGPLWSDALVANDQIDTSLVDSGKLAVGRLCDRIEVFTSRGDAHAPLALEFDALPSLPTGVLPGHDEHT